MKTGRKTRMSELSPCMCLHRCPSAARQNGPLLHLRGQPLCLKLSVKSRVYSCQLCSQNAHVLASGTGEPAD